MKINTGEFVEFLTGRFANTQYRLWRGILEQRPEMRVMNIDPKDHLCEVSIEVYGKMLEMAGKDKPTLIEIGGGLPREGFYLVEAGLIGRLVSIDYNAREVAQTFAMAQELGHSDAVESAVLDLEAEKAGVWNGIVVSRNFLYGAANSVEDYLFEPGKRVHVNNKKVIENTAGMADPLFGIIRIIANAEGSFNPDKASADLRAAGLSNIVRGSLPLKRYSGASGVQIAATGFFVSEKQFCQQAHESTKADYVIAGRK